MKLNKKSFYLLSFTWGLPVTAAGCLVGLFLRLTGHPADRHGWSLGFRSGRKNWGGMSWGPVFLRDRGEDKRLCAHEFGHAIQNCIYGPLMLPLVCLPSTLRYWTRRIAKHFGRTPKKPYDSVWFERQATELGETYIRHIEEGKL